MTVKTMYSFLIHHTYTSFSGIFGVVLGIAFIFFGFRNMDASTIQPALVYFFIGVMFVFGNPILLYGRAKKQVKSSPSFQQPICYELGEEGITVSQGDESNEVSWDSLMKVTTNGTSMIVYVNRMRALILPKVAFGEQYAAAVEMVSTHMPPNKVHFRSMK